MGFAVGTVGGICIIRRLSFSRAPPKGIILIVLTKPVSRPLGDECLQLVEMLDVNMLELKHRRLGGKPRTVCLELSLVPSILPDIFVAPVSVDVICHLSKNSLSSNPIAITSRS